LALGGASEDAILNVTGQERTVSQVFDWLALRVEQPLYEFDDLVAMVQEELEKVDVCLERHRCG